MNPDWAPTQNMGHDNIRSTELAVSRAERAKERVVKKMKYEAAQSLLRIKRQEDNDGGNEYFAFCERLLISCDSFRSMFFYRYY